MKYREYMLWLFITLFGGGLLLHGVNFFFVDSQTLAIVARVLIRAPFDLLVCGLLSGVLLRSFFDKRF